MNFSSLGARAMSLLRGTPAQPPTKAFAIQVRDAESVELSFPVSTGGRETSYFLMGLAKSGTVLMNGMGKALAEQAGVPFVDFPGTLFGKGIPILDVTDTGGLFREAGVCFGGFRGAWIGSKFVEIPAAAMVVVLVRDPRDILVSLYFSVQKSHWVPASGKVRDNALQRRGDAANTDIDLWVIEKAPGLASGMERLNTWCQLGRPEQVKFFKYEDVIFEKERWLREMSAWFGWDVPLHHIQQIAAKHDVRPENEDASRHIRKVAPGDHIEKLQPATIARLNEILGPVSAKFGYTL